MLIRTDTTNCATLTEKELSQHCAVVSCEHRNSTRSHDCRLFQSDCRIPKKLCPAKNSTAGSTRDSFTFSVTSPDSYNVHFTRVSDVFNSCCLMSNRWEASSVHQLSPNVNSLDTARLQIPTVSVLSPSATAFKSFIECFLAVLC